MPLFRSAIVVLLVVITTSCATREKLAGSVTPTTVFSQQTSDHFEFIEHGTFPASGSLYNMNDTFVGSCVLVTKSTALTAGHCIQLGNLKYARFGEETLVIDVQCIHKNYDGGDDLGLLIFETESTHDPMPIVESVDTIPKMYPITTIAHGEGKKKVSRSGVFRYYGILKNKPNEIVFLPLKTSVWFGDSGGALVYQDKTYGFILIGIITHFSTVGEDIYECAARRVDNFNLYDDIWQPWIDK